MVKEKGALSLHADHSAYLRGVWVGPLPRFANARQAAALADDRPLTGRDD